ncbi:hypothetical protein HC723_07540 [Vibrio sp. S11_S32]|uniref:hypothetical protein n=1 Tax=Vibrio sp. S11_S32 TaxID=2720225 RepID=UPI00168104A5|nr:hypothetical protein [Vibrio sp. S11_S32]MBD1576286.1 hypothetical protein [Vibrio sp. S11_S32]
MNQQLLELITELKQLQEIINDKQIHEAGFARHGWNQVHLTKNDVYYFLNNYIEKMEHYGDADITEGLKKTIPIHIANISKLQKTVTSHFNDQAAHLISMVPVLLLTLNTIFSDIDYELFSYENIQDKKLLPQALTRRLRSSTARLDEIESSTASLNEKINLINEAHDAAEQLPTDLESLKNTRNELNQLLKNAKASINKNANEIEQIKTEAIKNQAQIITVYGEISTLKQQMADLQIEAKGLVKDCDDSLQIATTVGLAAGFDQKERQLKRSIWVWIVGLLIALGSGVLIGVDRVKDLSIALSTDLTVGQAILQSVISFFSVGGPLWLAWISTQQINQRFKLSEDYAYKATVAKSFTGFKKQAKRFDEATEQRLFNSTLDRLDEMPLRLLEGKDYNSPWHEFIDSEAFKKAIDSIPSLATEAGRFASKTKLKRTPKAPKKEVVTPLETVSDE